jgi:REP element-mobilizing transposase RayT
MNEYNPEKHHRRSIRLKNYDYSSEGLYFITICIKNRLFLLGNVEDETMYPNEAGKMVEIEWLDLKKRFSNIELHEYVIMPNHFHGILEIVSQNQKTVGDILDAFKSITTVAYIQGVKEKGWTPFINKFWQRNYYEHIIRNETSYLYIADYIISNPKTWTDDKFNPASTKYEPDNT